MIGWVVVLVYAAALAVAAATTTDGELRPGDRPDDGAAAEALIDSWERSRTATFVRTGTFERRSTVTDARISSEDVLAQRPPQRLRRQLGGVDGRDDRRAVVCPSAPVGDAPLPCSLGEPTGPSYADDVASEVAGLRSLVTGASPLYAVATGDEPGCFDLVQLRVEPRAPFGRLATFCFDPATGAPSNSRVEYAGGIVEIVAVTTIEAEVTDADLRP